MRKIIILFVSLFFLFKTQAQYVGYNAVADVNRFKTQFTTATQKITSIKSNFVQEKTLSMLSEKIISKGNFWFLKDSKVRMEYTTPFQYLMILNKDKVYIKDGQKENKISTKSNKLFQQINQIMIDCMQGTALNNPNFKTKIFENKTNNLIELIPLGKGLKDIFKNVNVIVDKKDFSVSSIIMQEVSGDNTLLKFTNKELNSTLSDALFNIK